MADELRVLYVGAGDAAEIRRSLERADERLSVAVAPGSDEGLEALADGAVDCVVSGAALPDGDGVAFLEAVREVRPGLPVVVVAGEESETAASEALGAGADDYVPRWAGTESGVRLANAVRNAVELARAEGRLEGRTDRGEGDRRLAASLPEPVFHVDAEGRYVDIVGSGGLFPAERAEALVGQRFHDHLPTERADRLLGAVEETLATGSERTVEYRLDVSGETRWVEASVAPVASSGERTVVWAVHDVTGRVKRERELEAERESFVDVLEQLPTPVVYGEITDEGPVIERVNAAFEETFGYDRDAVTGENLDEVIVPEDDRSEAADINERLLEGEKVETEVRRRTADGVREFLLEIVARAETREGYAIYTDITERRRRKRELERQNDRLEEFVSVVSHDLRSPLTVAKGNLELAREEQDDPLLEDATDALDRMEALVDSLLTLAREGERVSDLETVDLETVAESCWTSVATPDAALRVETDRAIRADRSRVKQLLSNLYRTAVEHAGEDVTVTVGDLDDGFYVADDGPGIPDDDRERIFESGFTTDDEGTGFGLSIVAEIAEAHGWTVGATDGETGGARFEVTGVEYAEE
jgi:PAS domain S-box-containing protein